MRLLFKAPVLTASGYGVHSRQVLKGLLATGAFDISVKSLNWGNTSMIHERSPFIDHVNKLIAKFVTESENGIKYDVSVQVTIPNEFEKLAPINIGITAGIETNMVAPEWIQKSNDEVDILFVPSVHSKQVFEGTAFRDDKGNELRLNKPAFVAHEGFDARFYNTDPTTSSVELEPDFNFLFVGIGVDMRDTRKNVRNMVEWFCDAFRGRKDVGLVMKAATVNGSLLDFEHTKSRLEDMKRNSGCGKYPTITLIHGRMSDEELAALYKHPKVKALLTLTHGEGFGLPLLEAAACGLPIVATNWSGHLDFLRIPDVKRSFVEVDFDLKEVAEEAVWNGVIPKGSQWAYPKEEDAKLKMKKLVASYDKPKEWATQLAEHVAKKFTEEVTSVRLGNEIVRAAKELARRKPQGVDELVRNVREQLDDTGNRKLLYTMPMSAGDVFISSAVVDSLKKKYPDYDVYFATNQQYLGILDGNPNVHKVIPFNDWMVNVPICERIFDEVYTPNLAVQMTFSNWTHGGKGRLLAEEMANYCNVELGDYFIRMKKPETELPEKYIAFNPGSGKGQWGARNYIYWQDVIDNLRREMPDVSIVQVGMADDPTYGGCVDLRGKTNINELAWVIEHADLMLGIDSFTMHLAAAFGVDQVAIFGSSYAGSTGPVIPRKLETSSGGSYNVPTCKCVKLEAKRHPLCDKACYQYTCRIDPDYPCVNNIKAETICSNVLFMLGEITNEEEDREFRDRFTENVPKISGYTHTFNCVTGGYPFVESIRSMLGFCDEVIVVDGGSDDGTVEAVEAIGDERIKIERREWDWDEPGMDGMQKAYGRAMCTGEFLWQQDVDEVVHEDDYDKIRQLVRRFPKDVNLIHLPVVELWGDSKTCRTDRHSWKWRLSRNDFSITHGINKAARVIDEKTGKVYAKRGMSDGCEYIHIMTNEYIPHKGFYNKELDDLRRSNPEEYGHRMNEIFSRLPSVWHYSWADIPRKIGNFKQTWDAMWTNLYREQEPEDRFPQVEDENDEENITIAAKELIERGGEHTKAQTFKLEKRQPKLMEGWQKN